MYRNKIPGLKLSTILGKKGQEKEKGKDKGDIHNYYRE